jgi:excisionase family DNA binding protein
MGGSGLVRATARGNGDLMTTGEVAGMFGVSSRTIGNWVAAGVLPGVRTAGGHLRVRRCDAEALYRQRAGTRPAH